MPGETTETTDSQGHKHVEIRVEESLNLVSDQVRDALQDLSPEQKKQVAIRAGLAPDRPQQTLYGRW